MLDATLQQPKATRPVLASVILLWLALSSVPAGQVGTSATVITEPDWQKALTQGGLTLALLVTGWSYRKDLQKWADEKIALEKMLGEAKSALVDEKLAFAQAKVDEAIRYNRNLEHLVERTNETLKATSEAISAHTTAVVLNTEGTKRLAHVVERLDQRMERMEHGK
jgi:hypothetical protein